MATDEEFAEVLDAVEQSVQAVLAQKAWDDTVNTVLRATLTPAASGNASWAKPAADFAVSVADHVAAARRLRQAAGKVPLP